MALRLVAPGGMYVGLCGPKGFLTERNWPQVVAPKEVGP